MATENVEQFEIRVGDGVIIASIKDECFGQNGYFAYVGGCGIGQRQKTVAAARQVIFDSVVSSLKYRKEQREKELLAIDKAIASLGDDVFNLGKYKK